ncbi:MAG: 4-alpha-glucanotransferase [Pirellulales bacterium]
MVNWPRSSGILLHVTSLPGPLGNGDFGPAAYRFVDFLRRARQRYWQVLPLVPAAKGDSPYTSYSAFAGNPWLISPRQLAAEGFLSVTDVEAAERSVEPADREAARAVRLQLLRRSAAIFADVASPAQWEEFEHFGQTHCWWLDDYALFTALAERLGNGAWSDWPEPLRRREPQALAEARRELADEIQFVHYVQFQFARQWQALHRYAAEREIRIFGDIPIFVAYESADVWQHQELFHLDAAGRRTVVAGVPPDYFSATGQLWGNPLYRWDVMARDGFRWWSDRLRHSLALFDVIRLDHFRGFEAYWEVPAEAESAVGGQWVQGPGLAFFKQVEQQLGELPLVAEDLGLITQEVLALRDACRFPGMRVFQFGFDDDYLGQYHRPHSYPPESIAYTGTHDNDTAVGWYRAQAAQDVGHRVRSYLGSDARAIHWDMMRAVSHSASRLAVFPLQDVLGLDSTARMNVPGVSDGNWTWRCTAESLTDDLADQLAALTRETQRAADEHSVPS